MTFIEKLDELFLILREPRIRIDYWWNDEKYLGEEYIELIDGTKVESPNILTIKIVKTIAKNIDLDNNKFAEIVMDVVDVTNNTGKKEMLNYLSTHKITKRTLKRIKKDFEIIQKNNSIETKELETKTAFTNEHKEENTLNYSPFDESDIPKFFLKK